MSAVAEYDFDLPGTSTSMSYLPVMGDNSSSRPQTPHMSNSFSRLISSPSSAHAGGRASTLHTVSVNGNLSSEVSTSWLNENSREKQDDIFDKLSSVEEIVTDVSEMESPQDVPEGFDALPIELLSLIDR